MKQYITNCIVVGLLALIFTICFKLTSYQTLLLYFVMLTSFEIRDFIDNYKNKK